MYYPLLFKAGKLGYSLLKKTAKAGKAIRKKANVSGRLKNLRSSGYTKGSGFITETPGMSAAIKRKVGSAGLGAVEKAKEVGSHVRKYHKEYSSGAAGYILGSFLSGDDIDD